MSQEKIKKDLIELGKIGRSSSKKVETYENLDSEDGINRPFGTDSNKKSRDFIIELMEEAGMEVKIDQVGNIFGIENGANPDLNSILIGSHIDSVSDGSMFDGALGIVAGIEVVRRLDGMDFENNRSIIIGVFTAEEGSTFSKALLGSSVLAGDISIEDAFKLENEEGKTFEEILINMGFKGSHTVNLDEIAYALELHVEQGPVLFENNISVGIVEKITGYNWIGVTLCGQENHAGPTPMHMRKDALVGASDIIKFVNQKAKEMSKGVNEHPVGTVGKLNVFPNSTNIIPKKVEMKIDLRDIIKNRLQSLTAQTIKRIELLEEEYGLDVSINIDFEQDPVKLPEEITNKIRESATEKDIKTIFMNSGAGHDSEKIAKGVDTGMIFVPSKNGVSHSPMGWSEWNDIEKGVKVLTKTVKKLSK